MTSRLLLASFVVVTIALATQTIAAQTGSSKAAPATKSAIWTPPRTPWGHPDLQGAWTSDGARGIPRERPEQFGGRADLNDQEYAERVARDQQTIKNAVNASGAQTGGRDGFWRGTRTFRQTSLIVDPPDGRMPP